ncbi:MAG: 5-oxoprolinase subunit PxpA [Halomonadaceae bacterium]|nr:MAG: 5-oxoprolinase subunit PxpA [Halomonadaceae bacterium]
MNHPDAPARRLLLNCDMGESFGPWTMGMDEQVMPLVDMANVACGFHASDPVTMTRTVALAKAAGTRIGAHPSYPDLAGFGRRSMQCSHDEIVALVQYQTGALAGICQSRGMALSYVKPHGALYNDMMRDPAVLRAVLAGVAGYDRTLPLMVLASADNRQVEEIAAEAGVTLMFEAFADRAYGSDGLLLPRSEPGAVYSNPASILAQSLSLAHDGVVSARDGSLMKLMPDTLCVHGDNPASVAVIQQIRTALDQLYGES